MSYILYYSMVLIVSTHYNQLNGTERYATLVSNQCMVKIKTQHEHIVNA
jgi:hypothetical protein